MNISVVILTASLFVSQDVSSEISLKQPELYKHGQRQELSSSLTLCLALLYAVYSSLVLFFFPVGVFYDTAYDYQTMAITVAMAATFTATVEVRVIIYTCASKLEKLQVKL